MALECHDLTDIPTVTFTGTRYCMNDALAAFNGTPITLDETIDCEGYNWWAKEVTIGGIGWRITFGCRRSDNYRILSLTQPPPSPAPSVYFRAVSPLRVAVQFNPSTLKTSYNPATGKVQTHSFWESVNSLTKSGCGKGTNFWWSHVTGDDPEFLCEFLIGVAQGYDGEASFVWA